LYYRAPELLRAGDAYDELIDIWSVGCVIYEMAALKVLFKSHNQKCHIRATDRWLEVRSQTTINERLKKRRPLQEELWQEQCAKLVFDCLADQSDRISAADTLGYIWFEYSD
jgi:serine/threonine protein kinase